MRNFKRRRVKKELERSLYRKATIHEMDQGENYVH